MKRIAALLLTFFAVVAHGATIPVIDDRGIVTTAEGRLVSTDADFDIYSARDESSFCNAAPTAMHEHVLFIVVKHTTDNIKAVQETIITEVYGHSNAAVMTMGLWYANPGQVPARKLLDGLRQPIANQPLFGTDISLAQILTNLCK